jgi:hypothetical protein
MPIQMAWEMCVTVVRRFQMDQRGEVALTISRMKYGENVWMMVVVRMVVGNGINGVILFRVMGILMEQVMCVIPHHDVDAFLFEKGC